MIFQQKCRSVSSSGFLLLILSSYQNCNDVCAYICTDNSSDMSDHFSLTAGTLDHLLLDLLGESLISAADNDVRSLRSHPLFCAVAQLRDDVLLASDLVYGSSLVISKFDDRLQTKKLSCKGLSGGNSSGLLSVFERVRNSVYRCNIEPVF